MQDAANRVANTDVGEGISENIRALGKILQGGARINDLILVTANDGASPVIIEGHTRSTAYVIASGDYPVYAFLGSSLAMRNWIFY